jgi:hypothetical protein
MMQVTEKDVIETCEVHGFPLDPNQLEVVTAVVNQILLSARKPAAKSCQTGWADICHMAKHDGVTCPDDSCDIDDGIRAAPAQSGEPVEADVVPNEIAELLTEPCWNLSRRDVSDLLKRIGSILYAAPQPSQTAVALDERARFDDVAPLVDEWIRSRGTSMDGASYVAALQLVAHVKDRTVEPSTTQTRDRTQYPYLPCPICNGVEGCDHPVPERRRAAERAIYQQRVADFNAAWRDVSKECFDECSAIDTFETRIVYTARPAQTAQSGEPVEADVVPNEIAELLTEPCWNLSRRDVSDLLKRIGSILYTAPQSSQPVEAGEGETS